MQIKFVKMHFVRQQSDIVRQKRHEFEHSNITADLLKYLDSKNCFEGKKDIFTDEVIASGKLPDGYFVHHILPLYGGGSNDLDNLQIVDAKIHNFLHACFFHCRDEKFLYDKPVKIRLPCLKPVADINDYQEFVKKHMAYYLRDELQKKKKKLQFWERIERQELNRRKEQRSYPVVKTKGAKSTDIFEHIKNLLLKKEFEAEKQNVSKQA